MPSPNTPTPQNNSDVVEGPRKRRPSERVTENGDPLSHKKAKTAPSSQKLSANKKDSGNKVKAKAGVAKPLTVNRRASVEDIAEPAPIAKPQPRDPHRILEAADGSDDDNVQVIGPDLDMPGLEALDDDDMVEDKDEDEPEDDHAELERLSKEWDAPIYAFFKPTARVEYLKDRKGILRKAHVFDCAAGQCRCKSRSVNRFLHTSDARSTSNLRRHAITCWGKETVAAADNTNDVKTARGVLGDQTGRDGSITAAFERAGKGKVTYSHKQHTRPEARFEFACWMAENKRVFQTVNDRGFRSLMKTGRPECFIPSAEMVSRDVKAMFAKVREVIARMLREHPGKLSFATDCWTSPNHKAFMAITVHFEHKGKPISMLLDLVEVPKSHTGAALAAEFADVLRAFGIGEKILSVTGDNASNNDKMIENLGEILDDFPGAANQTRCFGHTLSISAKAILKQFDVPRARKGEVLDEAAQALADLAKELDVEERAEQEAKEMVGDGEDDEPLDMWEDFGYGLSDEQRKEMEVSVQPVRSMLVKLRKFSYAVKNSTTILLPEWFRTLKTFSLPECMMPRDVSTRWNSTYDMLEFAVKYRQAIDAMTAARDLDLRKYELVAAEWRIAGELHDVLKIFKDATLFFSRGTPNLTTVIPAMDHIDKVLATCSDSPYQFSLAIRAALAVGKAALNKYYNKTDHSEVYRIAMILHPRHKLEYFRKHEWEQEWIDAALQIVRDEFDRSYATLEADDGASLQGNAGVATSSTSQNIFDNLPDLALMSPNSLDELDRYLATPVEDVKDALMWWFERSEAYPLLSRMARDYLSIPATTVGVERVFSQGHLILPHVRNRLTFQTTRSLMCIGTWSVLGLVKYNYVKSVFGDDVEGPEDELPTGWDAITFS